MIKNYEKRKRQGRGRGCTNVLEVAALNERIVKSHWEGEF